MTMPRQVLPGTTYLITRRCFQRQLLLRASGASEIFLYVLSVAARRFGMRVHAFCVLSNHFHLVVTDPGARLPAFEQYLGSLVARAVNASLGRWESFWAPGSYSAVALGTPCDILDKAAYALANPVAAGLVRRAREWPGLWSDPALIGRKAIIAERPKAFFRADGLMPARTELLLQAPPGFASPEDFAGQLVTALNELEARHAPEGRSFLGPAWVNTQSPWAKPAAREPRRQMNPRVGARDRWKRVETLMRLATFLAQYRQACRAWTSGVRDVLFPAGTYALRVVHGVLCEAAT
jgi:REP element-mobilizing transposase RayT